MLNVSCLCVACVRVWSWFVLQFALQDLKIALATTPSVHPLFVLYCMAYVKCVCVCARTCVTAGYSARWGEMGPQNSNSI